MTRGSVQQSDTIFISFLPSQVISTARNYRVLTRLLSLKQSSYSFRSIVKALLSLALPGTSRAQQSPRTTKISYPARLSTSTSVGEESLPATGLQLSLSLTILHLQRKESPRQVKSQSLFGCTTMSVMLLLNPQDSVFISYVSPGARAGLTLQQPRMPGLIAVLLQQQMKYPRAETISREGSSQASLRSILRKEGAPNLMSTPVPSSATTGTRMEQSWELVELKQTVQIELLFQSKVRVLQLSSSGSGSTLRSLLGQDPSSITTICSTRQNSRILTGWLWTVSVFTSSPKSLPGRSILTSGSSSQLSSRPNICFSYSQSTVKWRSARSSSKSQCSTRDWDSKLLLIVTSRLCWRAALASRSISMQSLINTMIVNVDCLKVIDWLQQRNKLPPGYQSKLNTLESLLEEVYSKYGSNPIVYQFAAQQRKSYHDLLSLIDQLGSSAEGQAKTIFGNFKSSLLKQLIGVRKIYEREGLQAASVALLLRQLVSIDVPQLSKRIQRSLSKERDCMDKISRAKENAAKFMDSYNRQLGSLPQDVQGLLSRRIQQLAAKARNIAPLIELYQRKCTSFADCDLANLKYFVQHGDTMEQDFAAKQENPRNGWVPRKPFENQWCIEEETISTGTSLTNLQARQSILLDLNQLEYFCSQSEEWLADHSEARSMLTQTISSLEDRNFLQLVQLYQDPLSRQKMQNDIEDLKRKAQQCKIRESALSKTVSQCRQQRQLLDEQSKKLKRRAFGLKRPLQALIGRAVGGDVTVVGQVVRYVEQ